MCVALCCVTGIWIGTETQVPGARGSFFCSLYTAICSLLAALRITRRSDCLIQGQNFVVKKKKCVFWYLELSLIAASLLAEEAHKDLGTLLCYSFFYYTKSCLFKSETNSQVTRTLSPFSASAVKGCVFGLFFFLKHEISFSERKKKTQTQKPKPNL